MGSGLNLPYYSREKVDMLWGLEPVPQLKQIARKNAEKIDAKLRFIGLTGEEIPLDSNSVDTVVVTYTLCTIPDVFSALHEMKRVLKPEGSLLFCEHGQAPDDGVLIWQNRLNPFWKKVSGGCHLNRRIPELIKKAGFAIDHLEQGYISALKISGFNFLGSARKR